jgi:hypothetical protein
VNPQDDIRTPGQRRIFPSSETTPSMLQGSSRETLSECFRSDLISVALDLLNLGAKDFPTLFQDLKELHS